MIDTLEDIKEIDRNKNNENMNSNKADENDDSDILDDQLGYEVNEGSNNFWRDNSGRGQRHEHRGKHFKGDRDSYNQSKSYPSKNYDDQGAIDRRGGRGSYNKRRRDYNDDYNQESNYKGGYKKDNYDDYNKRSYNKGYDNYNKRNYEDQGYRRII